MNRLISSRKASLLGLVFSRRGIHVAHASGAADSIEAAPIDPLPVENVWNDPPQTAARLSEHLTRAGVRERRCIVALPAEWSMSVATELPGLPQADAESLLQLEAESAFPCERDDLFITRSTQTIDGVTIITQFAIRRTDVDRMSDLLSTAGLKPIRFTLHPAALPKPAEAADEGILSLLLSESPPSLTISFGKGMVTARTLTSTIETPAALVRDIRITFEECPPPIRRRIRKLRLLGEPSECQVIRELLAGWATSASISLEIAEWTLQQSAAAIASRGLQAAGELPNLLPPRPSRWEQWTRRYNRRRLRSAAALLAVAIVGIVAAFTWREYETWNLRREWAQIQPQVDELEGLQARIREFRPWHDTSYRTLQVLRLVTDVFPENGTVTAKSFEIRNQSSVTVTGVTRDNTALLASLEKLRQRTEVANLKVEQIRGKSPAQFSFTFQVTRTPES